MEDYYRKLCDSTSSLLKNYPLTFKTDILKIKCFE